MKRILSILLLLCISITVLSACGGDEQSGGADLTGRYNYAGETGTVATAIMKLTYLDFAEDGTVIYHQSECDFKGTYKKKGSNYVATLSEVEGPAATVNSITAVANGKNWKMDIVSNSDGSITVKADGLLAKSLGLSKETKYAK